jgi:hypothetical protein
MFVVKFLRFPMFVSPCSFVYPLVKNSIDMENFIVVWDLSETRQHSRHERTAMLKMCGKECRATKFLVYFIENQFWCDELEN